MNPTIRLTLAAATCVVALGGCTESARPQATGKSNIRGVNALSDTPALNFLIEERTLDTIDFRGSTGFIAFDDLSYNFNFDYLPPLPADAVRLGTQFIDVEADIAYTIALTGTFANPTTIFWEDAIRQWDGSETVFEAVFVHLGPGVEELDIYFASAGTVPVLGQAVGTLAFGERLALAEYEELNDGYELILTRDGDPSGVVFHSITIQPVAQTRLTFGIFDDEPAVPGNVSVSSIGQSGGSARLADVNFPSQARVFHAAFGTANFDGYLDEDFSAIVYPDVGFLDLSAYADVATGQVPLTVTQVGNAGAVIHEGDLSIVGASRNSVVLVGEPGELGFLVLPDTGRPVVTYPQLRILSTAFNFELLDIYVTDPGTPLDDVLAPRFAGVSPLVTSNYVSAQEGMRELTITERGDKTPIGTPLMIDLANGDILDVAIVDTADPNVVELLPWSFQPAP
ncbi:MAG: DUF4397 domain-containing protein [Woeseiaceae bacterium]|nr:DUF4397 domain-containing protein [Woeseiaceae bacterium]